MLQDRQRRRERLRLVAERQAEALFTVVDRQDPGH
jgi:hypothetical protein